MKHIGSSRFKKIGLAMLGLLAVSIAMAANPDLFGLSWFTIDGGGGVSHGGPYGLTASIGQPDTDLLRGGPYVLEGGFLVDFTAPKAGAGPQWWLYE